MKRDNEIEYIKRYAIIDQPLLENIRVYARHQPFQITSSKNTIKIFLHYF